MGSGDAFAIILNQSFVALTVDFPIRKILEVRNSKLRGSGGSSHPRRLFQCKLRAGVYKLQDWDFSNFFLRVGFFSLSLSFSFFLSLGFAARFSLSIVLTTYPLTLYLPLPHLHLHPHPLPLSFPLPLPLPHSEARGKMRRLTRIPSFRAGSVPALILWAGSVILTHFTLLLPTALTDTDQ